MGKAAVTIALFLLRDCCSVVYGQSRAEATLFFDCLGISQTKTDNLGLGARFGYRVHRHVMLEGEFTYSYGVNFQEAYRNLANGSVAAIEQTSIGVSDDLLGPKLQPARGTVAAFRHNEGGLPRFPAQPEPSPL